MIEMIVKFFEMDGITSSRIVGVVKAEMERPGVV